MVAFLKGVQQGGQGNMKLLAQFSNNIQLALVFFVSAVGKIKTGNVHTG